MSWHPGLGPEHSAHDAFWSDENLNQRAKVASYADIAPIHGTDGVNQSAMLLQMQQAGVPISQLGGLAEVEIDQGGYRDDRSSDLLTNPVQQPAAPSFGSAPQSAALAVSGDMLDTLADQLLERVMKRLGGQ